jgi:hypothetical protein
LVALTQHDLMPNMEKPETSESHEEVSQPPAALPPVPVPAAPEVPPWPAVDLPPDLPPDPPRPPVAEASGSVFAALPLSLAHAAAPARAVTDIATKPSTNERIRKDLRELRLMHEAAPRERGFAGQKGA